MRRLWRRVAIVCAAACTLSWVAQSGPHAAASPQPASATDAGYNRDLLRVLTWRMIGPNRGGRSTAVAGSPSRPLEYYFGATGGGLWKTTDGGTTWKPVTDAKIGSSSVGAVAVSASNPDVVYLGTGETQLRGNIIQGDGVYRSADGGKSWTRAGLGDTQAIARIRVHPADPNLVYVAALGHPYGPNEERGVFRSSNGGQSWERVLGRDQRTGAVDLVLDPQNPQVLFAALWEVSRTPHSLSSGGPGSGLFKSIDGGDTWTEVTRNPGLPREIIGKIGVAVSGAESMRVYAIVEARDGGIFRSDDGGATWSKVNDERRFRQRAFYYTRIYADPKERDTLYVLNTGLYRSSDGGKTWKSIRVPHGDNHDLWIAPDDPRRMINSNDGGANVSVNGGETWTGQAYPTAQLYHVITTAHVPYHVCGAQQDNSTACVPSNGNGNDFYEVGGGESGYIASDPRNPNLFYAGSYGGFLTRYDRSTGEARQINVWPENPMGHSSVDIRERFQWTFPIVLSPLDPRVLYVGSQHLWRSTSEGQRWDRISPDLTRADPATMGPSGGPITLDQTGVETYATIFTIAPAKQDPNTIWVGSDDGVISVTRDGGTTWNRVTPSALPEFSRISLVEASPHRLGAAYVAANRYQRDDFATYLFRTDDFGRTWTRIVQGIPARAFARAIREDPKRPGLLYAGTEHGIFVSFDVGGHWQSLALNLPDTPVHDIAVEEHDLVIATHGRSFYVLDSIEVLRQLTPDVVASRAHLFAPPDRVRSATRGVAIDYYLKEPADAATLEVLDARGAVVRTYRGVVADEKEKEKEQEEKEPAAEPEEGRRVGEPKLSTKAGMNRLVWDLRYSGPTDFPGMILWAAGSRGPLAPPGAYRARLSVAGEVRTQPFAIRKNPFLTGVTDADLQEQFTLALQIRDRLSQANDAVVRIRDLKAALKDRIDKAKDAEVTALSEALTGKVTDIEGEIYQYRNQSSQDPLNYPIKLNNKLAALLGVVESADSRPTDQSYVVFKELSGRLNGQLANLETLLNLDLPPLNKLLADRALPPVGRSGEKR